MKVDKKHMTRLLGLCLVIALAFGAGTMVGASAVFAQAFAKPPANFEIFWQAWDAVHAHFIDRDILDSKELTYGAIQGLVRALGDNGHTTFLTPAELEHQQTAMSGKFSGIGAQLGVKNGLPMIVTPFDGSPAAKAGVKAGDTLLAVNGEDVTGFTLTEIVERVRGEEGTQVTLTLLRETEKAPVKITITRGEIRVPAVSWAMIPTTKVALLRLNQFSANATAEMEKALNALKAAGATGLVVDVRNNPGGLLTQAIGVTSQFLANGNVLQEEDADGHRKLFPVTTGGAALEIPLVVLTNPGSASSSEIFVGAIQDYGRGQIIGETTFGTGTVLETFTLDDGSALLLGTRQWLTAKGRLIRNQGIAPDIEVKLGPDGEFLTPERVKELSATELLSTGDAQLIAALKALNALPSEQKNKVTIQSSR